MKASQEKDIAVLPFPEKEKLKRNEFGKISSTLQEIAQRENLNLVEVTPDIDSLIDDSGHLKMYVRLEGSFFDLHNFLIRLGEIPYLEHIEQLQIRTDQTSEDLGISLKIWLARDKNI
jgi:nitrous oxide reductase